MNKTYGKIIHTLYVDGGKSVQRNETNQKQKDKHKGLLNQSKRIYGNDSNFFVSCSFFSETMLSLCPPRPSPRNDL